MPDSERILDPVSQRCMVLIAAPDLIPRLKTRVAEADAELLTFSDTDALRALEAILKRKPNVVALERLFSATARGTALVNRIKADPTLTQAEIRIVGQDGTFTVVSPPPVAAASPTPAASAPAAGKPAAAPPTAPIPGKPAAAPSAGPTPGKPAAAAPTPARTAGPPVAPSRVVDVWGGPQPRRVDIPVPTAAAAAAPPPVASPVAPPPAPPPRQPVAAAPVEPVAEATPASAEPPLDAISLAAEIELAETELSAEWMIEPAPGAEPLREVEVELEVAETEPAVQATRAPAKARDQFEVVTNAGNLVGRESPQAPAVEAAVAKAVAPGAPAKEGHSGKHAAAKAALPAVTTAPGSPADAPAASPAVAPLLDQTGTRRAARFRMDEGAGLLLDGNTAKLVDLSTIGAQVLSSGVLKPNQRVRIALTDKQGAVKMSGSVAWALFEIPPRYRAGIAFVDADPAAVDTFCGRHKQS
jgi:hypothetical protein